MKVNPHKLGMVVGIFGGSWHTLWSILVAFGVAKPLLDWLLSLHFLSLTFSVQEFNLATAVILIIVTSVIGYILGYFLAWIWNWVVKK